MQDWVWQYFVMCWKSCVKTEISLWTKYTIWQLLKNILKVVENYVHIRKWLSNPYIFCITMKFQFFNMIFKTSQITLKLCSACDVLKIMCEHWKIFVMQIQHLTAVEKHLASNVVGIWKMLLALEIESKNPVFRSILCIVWARMDQLLRFSLRKGFKVELEYMTSNERRKNQNERHILSSLANFHYYRNQLLIEKNHTLLTFNRCSNENASQHSAKSPTALRRRLALFQLGEKLQLTSTCSRLPGLEPLFCLAWPFSNAIRELAQNGFQNLGGFSVKEEEWTNTANRIAAGS